MPGRIIRSWKFSGVIDGDMPGLLEAPIKAQETLAKIMESRRVNTVPKGKIRIAYIAGPIERSDGTKITYIFESEFDEAEIKGLNLDSSEG